MLEVKDVVVKRGNFSINNLSFKLDSGYIMGIIGENGAGKTTLFSAILDLLPLKQGNINIFGKDHSELSSYDKSDIGFVLGDFFCVNSYKTKGLSKYMKRIYDNWNDDKFLELCQKYKIPNNKRVGMLSTGMKAKLWLAIALSHDAKLLILDEPTLGLDPIAREKILDDIRDFAMDENHGVIISSHISSDLEKICDYVAFINDGKFIINEAKDNLEEQLRIIVCGNEEIDSIPQDAIISVKKGKEISEVLVKKELVNDAFDLRRPTLEEITIHILGEEI